MSPFELFVFVRRRYVFTWIWMSAMCVLKRKCSHNYDKHELCVWLYSSAGMYVRIKNVFMDIGVYVYASLRELICKTVFAFACACACVCTYTVPWFVFVNVMNVLIVHVFARKCMKWFVSTKICCVFLRVWNWLCTIQYLCVCVYVYAYLCVQVLICKCVYYVCVCVCVIMFMYACVCKFLCVLSF